jgi:poly [ADP-ribose] polymerase
MRGQVSTNSKTKDVSDKAHKTLLDAMGLTVVPIDDKDHQTILKLLGPNARQFKAAYKVINLKTQEKYEEWLKKTGNKSAYLFWHGSRNENWWSILDSGLLIRPSSAVITGAMFGYGIYFADKAQKSIGYTSLRGSYWASGSANRAYLAIFNVHTGNWLQIQRHDYWMSDLTENKLKGRGAYDSLFALGGADLRNNEYIVYNKSQCTIQYLVEIGD